MFQLIIAVISIALISALAIASIFYGGSAFNSGAVKSEASALINGAQQVVIANNLWTNEHDGIGSPNITNLVNGGYLSAVPVAGDEGRFEIVGTIPNYRVRTVLANSRFADVCKEVNRQANQRDDAPYPNMIYKFGCLLQNDIMYFYMKL